MYAQLGDITFEALIGPSTFDDNQETDFAEISLINRKPKLQRVGEKLQEISLEIAFKTAFCVPEEQFRRLNEKRANGEILTFVWGSGDVEGDFVIRSLKRTINALAPDGYFRDITVQVTLTEYYNPDKLGAIKKTATRNAFATSLAAPTPANIETDEPTNASDVMKDVADADLKTNQVNQKLGDATTKSDGYEAAIDKAQVFVTQIKSESYQLKKLIRGVKDLLTAIGVKLSANPALAALVPTMSAEVAAADTVVTAADILFNGYNSLPDPVTTLTEANQVLAVADDTVQSKNNLDTANKNLKKASQPLAVAIAARKDV